MNDKKKKTDTTSEVLIVGGGVSGLFAAWRLLKDNPKRSVTIVEKMDQVGGRLETTFVDIKGNDGKTYTVHDEDGGMRFVPRGSGMEHLWKLIDDLNEENSKDRCKLLKNVDFEMGDERNRYYVRGLSFTQQSVKDSNNMIWSTLYNLAPSEQGKNPSDILEEVMEDILKQNKIDKPSSPSEWVHFRNTCTYADFEESPIVLNKWGFWAILRRYGLSAECIEMLSHVLGFMGPFQDYINAGEGLQILFDFPDPKNASFQTLVNGFQSLPNTMAESIQKMGGKIILNETIQSVSKEEGNYKVAGTQNSYLAEKVILALPKEPLKKLIETSEVLSAKSSFMRAVDSVKNMELTKIGLYFKERWWLKNKSISLRNGPNFTDLPLGSVYTFSQFPEDDKKDAAYLGPAALTQYTDYIRGNYWKELQNIGEKYHSDEFPKNPDGTYPASRALVTEMMKQIKLLFGLDEDAPVPMPILSTYRVWGQEPFGYGYHQYLLNVDDLNEVYPEIWNPAENVFVCNESWSPEQGWVEGALIMSDYVLEEGFKMSPFASDSFRKRIETK